MCQENASNLSCTSNLLSFSFFVLQLNSVSYSINNTFTKRPTINTICTLGLLLLFLSCFDTKKERRSDEKVSFENTKHKLKVIYDTDANNELDDQHAQAYLLFNKETFDVKGIIVNATFMGVIYKAIMMKRKGYLIFVI